MAKVTLDHDAIRALHRQGVNKSEIARRIKCSRDSVTRVLNAPVVEQRYAIAGKFSLAKRCAMDAKFCAAMITAGHAQVGIHHDPRPLPERNTSVPRPDWHSGAGSPADWCASA